MNLSFLFLPALCSLFVVFAASVLDFRVLPAVITPFSPPPSFPEAADPVADFLLVISVHLYPFFGLYDLMFSFSCEG